MARDVLITPASGLVDFLDSSVSKASITLGVDGILTLTGGVNPIVFKTSTSGSSILRADGTSGTVFEITDDLSDSLMSVNTIAGLPVFEVFADNHIVAGRYNQNDFYLDTNGNVGIGTTSPTTKLDITGAVQATFGHFTGWAVSGNKGAGLGLDVGISSGDGYVLAYDRTGGTGYADLRLVSNASQIHLSNVAGGAIEMSGKVGIGTTNTGNHKLKVVGETHSTHFITGEDWLAKTGGLHIGNDGLTTGAVSFYNSGDGGGSANIYRDSNVLYVGARSGVSTRGLAVDVNGNVGIGTVTPSQKLHVVGKALITDDLQLTGSSPRIDFNTNGASSLRFYDTTNAAERMRINTSGNLGINTTSPTSKLQVVGSTSGDSVLKVDGTNGTLFEVVDDLSDSLMSVNDAAGLPVFEVFADNHIVAGRYNQNDFYLDTNGNVGIGTASPGNKLSIVGSTTTTNLAVTGGGSFSSNDFGTVFKTTATATKRSQIFFKDSTDTITSRVGNDIEGANSAKLQFVAGSGSTPHMSILSGGNVGIGTTSPQTKLEIFGGQHSSNYPSMLSVVDTTTAFDTSNNGGGISFGAKYTSSSDVRFIAGIQGVKANNTSGNYGGALRFLIRENGTSTLSEKMRIAANGNVGIGTDDPDSGLTIAKAQTSAHTYTTNHLHLATPSTANNGGATTISFATSTSDNYGWSLSAIREATNGSNTRFAFKSHNNSDSGSELLSVLEEGKVGIGTVDPQTKLEIKTTTNSSSHEEGLRLYNAGGSVGAGVKIGFGVGAIYGEKGHIRTDIISGGAGRLFLGTNGTDRIVIDSVGNVGIGITNPLRKLHVAGSALISNSGGLAGEGGGLHVSVVGGGGFATSASSKTGYLVITLPVSWTSTMLQFTVDIFEYSTGKSKSITLSGYNHSGSSSWINVSAYMTTDDDTATYTARFGHDGTKCAIYIDDGGGASSSWSYPQVRVRDFFAGYNNYAASTWIDGWNVGFSTATPSPITAIRSISDSGTIPNAPASASATIVGETVDVTFAASTTSNIDAYLVYSSIDGSDYGLISVIPPEDFSSSMSVIDNSFNETGTQAYRVYAMKTGNLSSAATASVSYTVSSAEPTSMNVVDLNNAFYVQWNPPSSNERFVTAYNVYKDENAVQASLSRSNATLIYSGLNTNYMYQINGTNNNNFHQFWVETTIA